MCIVVTCNCHNLFICIFLNSLPKPNPCEYKTLCDGPVNSYMKPAAISRLKGQAQSASNKQIIGAGRPAESRSGSSLWASPPVFVQPNVSVKCSPFSEDWNRTETFANLNVGVHEGSLSMAHPGYQVLSDILFRLGLIANALTQCSS